MKCIKCGKQIDDDSKFCIHCGYSQIEQSSYSKGSVEPFIENGKWGFKDKDSRDIIIPPKYTYAGFFKENRAVVGLNDKYSIINKDGKELTPFKYDFISDFENGFAKVKRDEKWTFLNFDCKEIIAFKFDSLESFNNCVAKVEINNNYAIINQNGDQISEFYESILDFKDSVAVVKRNQKFGLINSLGKKILSCEYDSIGSFSNGLAKISGNGKFGLIDISGKIILTREYDSIGSFSNGLAKISKNQKIGLIDNSGKIILTCEYDNIDSFTNGIAKISKSDNYGFINSSGKIIISCKYERVLFLGDDSIAAKLDNTWMCFNKEGNDVTETNNEFRRFQKGKRRKKNSIWFLLSLILLFVLAVYDYNTNKIGVVKIVQTFIYGKDEMDWRYAEENLTNSGLSSMETYLRLNPNGKYASTARNKIEEIEWNSAKIFNTLASYQNYIGKYPLGKFVNIAQTNIEQLTWGMAVNSDLKANYENYIHDYPNGQYREEAKDYLAWEDAKNLNIFQSYQDYLINYPNGKNIQPAIDALLLKCTCYVCNGTGKCSICNGSGIFGQTQKLVYDICPNINRLFHGKHCKLCGGTGRINERYIPVDSQCSVCNGSGKCNMCKGLGKIQNEWLNTWYAKKINCPNCSGTGYIEDRNTIGDKKPCPVCNLILNKKN